MLDKLLEKLDAFLNNNKRSTHIIATIATFLFGAFFLNQEFHDFVISIYAALPVGVGKVLSVVVALYLLYRNGQKPPAPPTDGDSDSKVKEFRNAGALKKSLAIAMVGTLLATTACSTSWLTTLDDILAVAAPALVNILNIFAVAENQQPNVALAAQITADTSRVKSLAHDFANASSSAAPGVCEQLNAAVSVYSQDEQQVIALARVKDPAVQSKIAVLSGLVATTIQSITSVIPNCADAAKARRYAAEPPMNLKRFVADYDATLVAPTGNTAVDKATPKMKLHKGSRVAHYASFGIL